MYARADTLPRPLRLRTHPAIEQPLSSRVQMASCSFFCRLFQLQYIVSVPTNDLRVIAMCVRPIGKLTPCSTTNAADVSSLASENSLYIPILRLNQRQICHDHTLLRLLMS